MALTLANCSPQAGEDQANGSSHPALAACQRADVQEVIGKETRSKLFKSALPKLMLQEWLGLDTSRAIADFDHATVTFDHVAVDKPETLGEAPYQQIICTGHVQIDMSNATAGQQIIGIDGLRWVINISGQPADPTTDAFTVDVDDLSIDRGLTVNGRSPAELQQERANQNAASEGDADPGAGGVADEAAAMAAQAAAEADAALAQSQSALGTAPQSPVRENGANNPPSEEDLYAPH